MRLRYFLFAGLLATSAFAASSAHATGQIRDLVVQESKPDHFFRWIASPLAGSHPKLLVQLRKEALAMLVAERAEAVLARSSARNWRTVEWSSVGDTPQLLSLVATDISFKGGAHPNTAFKGMIWSKKAGKTVQLFELFADFGMATEAMAGDFCERLNNERQQRLRGQQAMADRSWRCPEITDFVVAPIAPGDSEQISAIQVFIPPAVVGAYSEGEYRITLPISRQVHDQLKPEWKAAFKRGG
jgi:hypothetical protein